MALSAALEFAEKLYSNETWKKTSRPMVYHALAVAALVLRFGGTDEQAQAALLHDTLGNPEVTPENLTRLFGSEVSRLVFAFEDPSLPEGIPATWTNQKKAYLEKVRNLDQNALLVILCEELHELEELVRDLRSEGRPTWDRYPVPDRDMTWYYRGIAEIGYKTLNESRFQNLVKAQAYLTRELAQFVHEGASLGRG